VVVYIYIVNYIDMRIINENDMSRIIKKVLHESEKSDGGVELCFKVARIPMPPQCKPQPYFSDNDMVSVINPLCVDNLIFRMVTNPTSTNITTIGKLCTCLGALNISRFQKKFKGKL